MTMTKLLALLRQSIHSRLYWGGLILLGLALEGAALYYQYALDEWPCVLCIHIRIWIFGFLLVAILAWLCTHSLIMMRLLHGLSLIMMIGFLERSYQVLAVERGWIFGDCDMALGMPSWFALDQWFPAIFEVQTSCGYTPLILFQISMAEILIVIAALLTLLSATLVIMSCLERTPTR